MAYQTGLANFLRAGGCQVIEQPGWQTRGHGSQDSMLGVMAHHTAGGGSNDWVIVQNGRSDLAGPLAHMTLERNGVFRVIAAGQCWHAGTGYVSWCGRDNGNAHMIGIEGVSNGTSWTDEQRREYPKGVAALLKYMGLSSARLIGHKEWAPGRKVDPGNWDMNAFRNDVAKIMNGVTSVVAPNKAKAALLLLEG